MGLPFNFTNPGVYIPGLLTSQEAQYVTDLVDLTYAEGDILYYDGAAMTNLAVGTDGHVLTLASGVPTWAAGGGGGGYTNLTEFVAQTAWRVFYSNGSGDVTELALGADGTYLKSNGASSAPTFATPAGSGDVSKVGTPVDNQIGVWTGDGTIEGDAALTFNTATDVLSTGGLNLSGLTASQIAATDGSKNIQSLSTATYPSLTELSYVKGVTGSIQTQITAKPTISSGAGAPGSTPTKVGDIYIDTTGDDAYIAVGTASSADWEKTNDGTGVGSYEPNYLLVAASDATAREIAAADYTCDGTADEVQINTALDLIRATGGTVILSSGTFAIAASINMLGNVAEADDNPLMRLFGTGSEATTLIGGSNINVISTGQRAKYEIAYFTAVAAGSGDCISQTAGTERGNWQSWIHDVYLQGNFSNHTGWGLDMQSPFRMRLENIEMNGVANGCNFVAHTDAFNPGNLTVDRMFIDLWNDASNASAIGFQLKVNGTTSTNVMNLVSVNRLDIAGGTALTSSIGISIVGASASYGDSRHHTFTNLNIEDIKTCIKHVRGRDCSYNDLNYCRPLSGGTIIELDSNSHNNSFENLYAVAQGSGQTFNLILDSNGSSALPNSLTRVDGYQPATVTINATLATNTIINRLDLSGGSPTIDSDITNRNNNIRGNTIEASTGFVPDTNDGAFLGTTTLQFSDLFLAEGGVINWDNGDATITQSGNTITVAGITAFDTGTSTALTAGTIEIGNASDTTLSRSSAGVLAVEGAVLPTISSTNTFTNKRVTKRVLNLGSSATPTINTDLYDIVNITGLTVDITSMTTNLSGTATDGQQLRINYTGTAARAITHGASFANGPVALPTTTVTTTRLSVLYEFDGTVFRCMASGSTV